MRRPLLLVGLLLVSAGLLVSCSSSAGPAKVHVLTWKGEVNDVMARYVDRGISKAEKSNAPAVVLRLDTPGGLDTAMRNIIQHIESSTVPVIVYVSPSGGRAASAGTFITMAGNIAAMSPNTSIGAATPIDSSGQDIPGALGRKVTNDAVSYIRGIAELRGRNADWAEQAVRNAVSVDQNEAVSQHIVDYVATDVTDLLNKADGRTAQVKSDTGTATVTLHTAGVGTYDNNVNIFEQFLNILADPNIAYLLLSLGSLAILIELFHPTILLGLVGVIALVLAFFSLGSLPTNWAGVALILVGFVLLGVELHVHAFGAIGIGGIVSIALGGLILMGSGSGVSVSPWIFVPFAIIGGGFFMLVVGTIVRIRRMPSLSTIHRLVGLRGETRTRLNPSGYVMVRGERWDATAEDPPLEVGERIVVTAASGLRLKVKRAPVTEEAAEPPPSIGPQAPAPVEPKTEAARGPIAPEPRA